MGIKCVVCGMESDRKDWIGNPNPQCDIHKGMPDLTEKEAPIPAATPLTYTEPASPPPPTYDGKYREGESKEGPIEHFVKEVKEEVEELGEKLMGKTPPKKGRK